MKNQNLHTELVYFDPANNHDKVYNVTLEGDEGDGYVVNFEYGRRGNQLNEGTKTPEPVSYEEAVVIYDKLIASKIKKGYEFYE